jgi:hypothetical protein
MVEMSNEFRRDQWSLKTPKNKWPTTVPAKAMLGTALWADDEV